MAEPKYGRLFTEEDVMQIAAAARQINGGVFDAIAHIDEGRWVRISNRETITLTFPADEPLFLLRGQDKSALYAFAGGYSTDLHRKHEASPEFIAAVNQAHMVPD